MHYFRQNVNKRSLNEGLLKAVMLGECVALSGGPIERCRKPLEVLDGHGTSAKGRCEDSPDPSEVSALGKLSMFSNHQMDHS
jgi:hypothetical protein